jgi:dihydrofolate reductase
VASHTLTDHTWKESVFLNNNIVEEIQWIKKHEGPDLQVHGSGNLIQTLLKNDLIDEFWLKIFPVVLGSGKRLFESGTMPRSFKLVDSKTSPSGVIVANFTRDGEVKTGSF